MIEKRGEVGRGAHGVVYEGWDPATQRSVAVKMLQPAFQSDQKVARTFREQGRRLAGVVHPNVIGVHDVAEVDGQDALIMEAAEGSLEPAAQAGGMSPEQVVEVLRQAAEGLRALAGAGIFHRDIKPSNLLVIEDAVKIGDLGVVRGERSDATMVGAAPRYTAPELLTGVSAPDEAPDLYSLGLVAYELVLGRPQVDELVSERVGVGAGGANWMAWNVSPRELAPLNDVAPNVPGGLATIVLKLLRKDASRRYATHADLLADLARWQDLPAPGAEDRVESSVGGAAATVMKDAAGAKSTLLFDRNAAGSERTHEAAPPLAGRRADAGAGSGGAGDGGAEVGDDEGAAAKRKRNMLIGAVAVVWIAVAAWFLWPAPTPPTVHFVSTPVGATVTEIGTGRHGTAPFTLTEAIPAGRQYRFELEDHEPATVTLAEGQTRVEATLVPIRAEEPVPIERDALPTAGDLAQRIIRAGSSSWNSRLQVLNRSAPREPLPSPLPVGLDLQFRYESPRPATLLVFHLSSEADVTMLYPHQSSGFLRHEAGDTVMPIDSDEHVDTTLPAGREWVFVVSTTGPLAPPSVPGSIPFDTRWLAYPLQPSDGMHPSVLFVDWLEKFLKTNPGRWSLAWVEYDVSG